MYRKEMVCARSAMGCQWRRQPIIQTGQLSIIIKWIIVGKSTCDLCPYGSIMRDQCNIRIKAFALGVCSDVLKYEGVTSLPLTLFSFAAARA